MLLSTTVNGLTTHEGERKYSEIPGYFQGSRSCKFSVSDKQVQSLRESVFDLWPYVQLKKKNTKFLKDYFKLKSTLL